MPKRNTLRGASSALDHHSSKAKVASLRELVASPDATAKSLSNALYEGFLWQYTPQGDLAWHDVHQRLWIRGDISMIRFELAIMLEELDRWLDA
jgi:hypothetical protein